MLSRSPGQELTVFHEQNRVAHAQNSASPPEYANDGKAQCDFQEEEASAMSALPSWGQGEG